MKGLIERDAGGRRDGDPAIDVPDVGLGVVVTSVRTAAHAVVEAAEVATALQVHRIRDRLDPVALEKAKKFAPAAPINIAQ